MTEAKESITEAVLNGHKLRANTAIYQPRPGLAKELRRLGNDVVEEGDWLLVNQTGDPHERRY
jgi:hypothetical protein